jgi:[protein-PII] uridylyltransferase
MKTPSDSSIASIASARAALLARTDLPAAPLRAALADLYDSWLAALLPDTGGIALLAVGGLGRREPVPHGDLDLVLLHDGRSAGVAAIADQLWYPVWDAGIGLDHSVRTPEQAISVAGTDLKAMLGMLDAGWPNCRNWPGQGGPAAATRPSCSNRI